MLMMWHKAPHRGWQPGPNELGMYEELPTLTKIYANIWVERSSQKSIVIGKQGEMLKKIGTEARIDIEKLLDQKVYLQLWVKVKKGCRITSYNVCYTKLLRFLGRRRLKRISLKRWILPRYSIWL